jgi:hypothetical protein
MKRERRASPRLIAEFQLIVRRYAKGEEPTIELPTDFLVPIADALDYVRPPPGRPQKSRPQIFAESIGISKGRLMFEELKKDLPAPEALKGAAIDTKRKNKCLEKRSTKTIEDRIQRNGRRGSKPLAR